MTWERAIWPAEPARAACEAKGINEARLRSRYRINVRWNRRPYLTTETADRIACEVLQVHPTAIWGQAWWDAVPDDEALDLELSYG